jgi:two-component system, OmpR family, heavy metal sensor histidine kinase CusS
METVEALDDQAAARLLAESRRRAITVTAASRLAAGVAFLVIGIVWTTVKQMSMGVLALPLFVYIALASTAFTCGQSAVGRRLFWIMPFVDIVLSFVIFRSALHHDGAFAASWAVVSLAVYTLLVSLAGLSLPLWLVGVVTGTATSAQAVFLRLAGQNVWPMLVSALALGFVAAATSMVQRRTAQALRQAYEAETARATLARIRGQNQALERLQREKDSLLELIVHDMRSPVSAALLSLEYIAIELKKRPNQTPLLEAVDDGLGTLNNLSRMISQILDISKLESGRITLRLDVVPLRPLVENAVREALPRAFTRNIKLDFEAREDIQAAVDLRLMPRMLDVILSHGLRHTPDGGRMFLAVTATEAETRISLHATVPSLSAAEREHAFDKFPMTPADGKRMSAWGLGLYFCKLVAASHQGTIAAEEIAGWPLSFVIRLPPVPRAT